MASFRHLHLLYNYELHYLLINCFIGELFLFLGVSWITNSCGGSEVVNDLAIQPYTPNQTHVRCVGLA